MNFHDKIVENTKNSSKIIERDLKAIDRALIKYLELRIQQKVWCQKDSTVIFLDCWREITRNCLRYFQGLGMNLVRFEDSYHNFYITFDAKSLSEMKNKLDVTKLTQPQVDRAAINLIKATITLASDMGEGCCKSHMWNDISDNVKNYIGKLFEVTHYDNDSPVAMIDWEHPADIDIESWYAHNYKVTTTENGNKIEIF